jgi:hypothetical protein
MKKTTLLLSIFSLAFCFGVNAQYASLSFGLEGWECDSLEVNINNYSDTTGLVNPTVELSKCPLMSLLLMFPPEEKHVPEKNFNSGLMTG